MSGSRAREREGERPAAGEARRPIFLVAGAAGLFVALSALSQALQAENGVNEAKHGPNRLAREKSPYLLQHAGNPVDWYPWGSEAFEKARREDRPIFLSVGYSTCHWCHVMERESFEDAAIAGALNRHFVSIKVDREERPDVDRVYMTFVQASTGSGGWPMSVFLTPDLKPFFGGTYFPPDARYGRPGFKEIVERIAQVWANERARVVESGEQIVESLRRDMALTSATGPAPDDGVLAGGYRTFAAEYDAKRGGFGGAPKFPRPAVQNFLLRHHARTGEAGALDMTLHTLREMSRGGMYDHLGGGFHRYSVDERWHVPHFEKMLYDQGQLAVSYLEAYQITRGEEYAAVARDILEYVLRDMTHPRGGFYSAEDADSAADPAKPHDKREGAFYVWEAAEIRRLLGSPAAGLFELRYGVEASGNVRHDPHGEFTGRNILYAARDLEDAARQAGREPAEAGRILAEARHKLFETRARRPRPHLDDKIITAWNGLMISALARAGAGLEEPRYVQAASRAARFLLDNLVDPGSGDLRRRWREGEAAFAASSLDYACLVQALLDLYEATFDVDWLRRAVSLQERQIARFWDEQGSGFWETTGEDPSVLLRMKEDYDGAEPSSNSLAALNLLRLAQLTDRQELRDRAGRVLGAFGSRLRTLPHALPQMLVALDYALAKPRQVVIAGRADAADTRALLREVRSRFLPHAVVMLADGGAGQEELGRRLPFLRTMKPIEGKATAYICENYACDLPTTDPAQVASLLDRARRPPKRG